MAGPHVLMRGRTGEERRLGGDVDLRASVFALRGRFHFAVEEVRRELHPVADAEDGDAELEDLARAVRRRFGVNRFRSAGEHDRLRRQLANFVDREVVGMHDGVHAILANPPGDQLRVLGAEIENEDGLLCLHDGGL